MNDQNHLISNAFQTFLKEAPEHSKAWGGAVQGLSEANKLDSKTTALAYLSLLAALRIESGIPFHVQSAKNSGASREEIISAILLGFPLAGIVVTQVLPAALKSFDEG